MPESDSDIYGRKAGIVRTDLYCHSCHRNFIAKIDFDVDGQHVVECPGCGHHHFRHIKDGVVTGVRYNSDSSTVRAKVERGMWKSNTVPMETSVTSVFLRQRWLDRSDVQ